MPLFVSFDIRVTIFFAASFIHLVFFESEVLPFGFQ